MALKLKISGHITDEYGFIAISSHLKDYRLTFMINESLGLQFKRINDLTIQSDKSTLAYSLFRYSEPDHRIDICLISNHHPEGKLIPSLKQTDYFMVIIGFLEKSLFDTYIKKLKKISGVLMAYRVSPEAEKQVLPLINDLEMHLLDTDR
jgi:hypothetical protein